MWVTRTNGDIYGNSLLSMHFAESFRRHSVTGELMNWRQRQTVGNIWINSTFRESLMETLMLHRAVADLTTTNYSNPAEHIAAN